MSFTTRTRGKLRRFGKVMKAPKMDGLSRSKIEATGIVRSRTFWWGWTFFINAVDRALFLWALGLKRAHDDYMAL